VLADPVRLRLVSIIATSPSGEVCACDLPESLDRSQPTVSHHLSLLVNAGVLDREQRGKWAWFRLRRERLDELGAVLSSPTRNADQSGDLR
jgi:ArsR family transcriptional regulator